jgi:hypothetical protein
VILSPKHLSVKKIYLIIYLSCSVVIKSNAQTISVGSYAEDLARRNQVLGNDSNSSSFTIRPVVSQAANGRDSIIKKLLASKLYSQFTFVGIPSGVQILPFNWLNEYNVKRPYGYNNASLYPNAGYQSMISGGFLLKAGILTIQVKPELVYAQNKRFDTFADIQANNNTRLVNSYFGNINGIDAPERFGNSSIKHLYPGQSKIALNYKGVEAGMSTENLWWGSGIKNSIMMSNSAPGFLHWTFNSAKPLKTIVGSFEWEIIGGDLKQSGFMPDDGNKLIYGSGLYSPKPVVTRYLSAYAVNWQPKWLNGLYLGLTGYDYLDKDSIYRQKSVFRKIFPVITGSSLKANDITNATRGDGQDFAFALNIRQLLPAYNAELYFEWARNDRTGGFKDFVQEPAHSAAYTVGGRKLFELSNGRYLQFKAEITQLQRSITYLVRDEPTWYEHYTSPRDGYTNNGRYLGAGIGPGSNSFILDISYLKDINSFGITFERLLHNNDLYYNAFAGTMPPESHWVDLSGTFYANLKVKNYLLAAEMTPVYMLNYQYKSGESFNLHARLNLTYYFE